MRVGFFLSYKANQKGGHKISTAEIANSFINRKHEVIIFCHVTKSDREVYSNKIKLVNINYYENNSNIILRRLYFIFNIIYRNILILWMTKKYKTKDLIASDPRALYSSYIFSLIPFRRMYYIQFGGKLTKRRILPFINYISTSKEWFDYYSKRSNRDVYYIPGQVNINKYSKYKSKIREKITNILIIMRMDGYLDIWETIAKEINDLDNIDIFIAGGGDLEKYVKGFFKNKNITYLGIVDVDGSFLCKYDVIIGQGRTAIESLLTGTITIIPGNDHLVDIVTTKNIDQFKDSNFTGRNLPYINNLDSLISDRVKIDSFYKERNTIINLLTKWYSSDNMVTTIENIHNGDKNDKKI